MTQQVPPMKPSTHENRRITTEELHWNGGKTPWGLKEVNPLYTERTPPHDILEDSNFDLRCVRLCNLDIRREKWLNFLQTVETLIRRRVLRRLIWVSTV